MSICTICQEWYLLQLLRHMMKNVWRPMRNAHGDIEFQSPFSGHMSKNVPRLLIHSMKAALLHGNALCGVASLPSPVSGAQGWHSHPAPPTLNCSLPTFSLLLCKLPCGHLLPSRGRGAPRPHGTQRLPPRVVMICLKFSWLRYKLLKGRCCGLLISPPLTCGCFCLNYPVTSFNSPWWQL